MLLALSTEHPAPGTRPVPGTKHPAPGTHQAPGTKHQALSLVLLALFVLPAVTALAQGRTDVVTLANGDRITGEVIRFQRGQLEFKTDDAGTIYVEWDNIARLEATRLFEVVTSDGRRFLGQLGRASERSVAIVSPGGIVSLPIAEVTIITPIGTSFWKQLDGSVDAGFSYTRSSGVAQLNVNSDTVYSKPAFEGRLALSLTATRKDEDGGRDDRGSLDISYVRFRWQRWFVSGGARFESNESLGLRLRSQVVGVTGPRLVNTNRAQLLVGGGLAFNDERGVDVEATRNLEAILGLRTSYFTYDRPKTNLDLSFQYYPSLSNAGRHRLQLDASARRELWKDFFVGLNLYDTFDSRPPNPDADTNDIGIAASVGWSY